MGIVQADGSCGGPASRWGGFAAFWAALVLVFAFSARPAAAAPFAYVANEGGNTIAVIDTATNKVLTGTGLPILVGNVPIAVAVTPDGTHAYVANLLDNTISVIDTVNNTVLTGTGFPIPVGSEPTAVAVSPDGTRAYVANAGAKSVLVIDTATNTVLTGAGFPIPVGSTPIGVAITPDGKYAYVTNESDGTVSVIDTNPSDAAYNSVVATIPVGSNPYAIAVTPDGTHAYVTDFFSAFVSVIDIATNTVLTGTGLPIPVGTHPIGVAVTPDGTHAYVTNFVDNTVSVIDTNPSDAGYNSVVATIRVGSAPRAVAVTPDGTHAYVANRSDNTVSVIATGTNIVLTGTGLPIPVGGFPSAVAIGPAPSVMPALQVTPGTNIVANAAQGGAVVFSPAPFDYTLSAINGNVQVSITGIPTWLNPSFSSPTTIMPGSPLTDMFSLNIGSLPRGTYNATIAFTNTTNGQGSTTRTATLTIYNGDDCKDGGWQNFISPPGRFMNQGLCVSYFANIGAPP